MSAYLLGAVENFFTFLGTYMNESADTSGKILFELMVMIITIDGIVAYGSICIT
jgi:hypothetical protein